MTIRSIRDLAARIHERWTEYTRRHPGMSVPISDSMSRILEHAPEYKPPRRRGSMRMRSLLQNPGIFTMQRIAESLETTVGDLLGEPGYESPRDLLTVEERRTLRDAVSILRKMFDLDDPSI
jgi:hypothetical protein